MSDLWLSSLQWEQSGQCRRSVCLCMCWCLISDFLISTNNGMAVCGCFDVWSLAVWSPVRMAWMMKRTCMTVCMMMMVVKFMKTWWRWKLELHRWVIHKLRPPHHPTLDPIRVCVICAETKAVYVCVMWLQKQAEMDIRSCCLAEIRQTEEKYTETLESIEKVYNLYNTHLITVTHSFLYTGPV